MHDELSLHNLKQIINVVFNKRPIEKIDPIMVQSTYMGNSVFHLCYNNFAVLEKLHLEVCGTTTPGEVGEIHSQNVEKGDIRINTVYM